MKKENPVLNCNQCTYLEIRQENVTVKFLHFVSTLSFALNITA